MYNRLILKCIVYNEVHSIIFVDSAPCVAKITPQNITACQVPEVAVHGNTNEISANTVVLTCTILSTKPVTSVRWTKDSSDLSFVGSTKYGGVTLGTHNLTIINSEIADSGTYVCYATNAMGEGQSNSISVTEPTVVAQGLITVVNEGNDIVITCIVISEITVTAIKWTKDGKEITIAGNSKYGGVTLGTHNLTVFNAELSDSGKYVCNASNGIGENGSEEISVTVIHVCLCSCEYQRRLEYWASQPNHTIEEWREILAPILVELAKNITVKKSTLSNTIRKLTSAKDKRPSSTSIGVVGITIVIFVCIAIVSADIFSFCKIREFFHRRIQPDEA